jgi:hypothetical protein
MPQHNDIMLPVICMLCLYSFSIHNINITFSFSLSTLLMLISYDIYFLYLIMSKSLQRANVHSFKVATK